MFIWGKISKNKVKQSLKQKQKLSLNLTLNLQKQIELLSLSGLEIRSSLEDLINEFCKESKNKKLNYFKDEILTDRIRNTLCIDDIHSFTEYKINKEIDLQEKLLEQLEISSLKEYEILIGKILIDSILENGRLDPELENKDIKRMVKEDFDLNISNEKIESVLRVIQNFEPAGCGYRSILESLKIQVKNLDIKKEKQNVVIKSLNSLLNKETEMKDLDPEIKLHIDKLNLNQGLNFGSHKDLYVRPDLFGICQKGIWQVTLNDDFMNKEFLEIIKDGLKNLNNKRTLEAKIFLRGLERRQQTLFVVGQYILAKQNEYLNKTSERKPITNKEIAKALQISESTVSRIVKKKYIQLPDKIIPLKNLLQKRVNKEARGNDITPEELKNYITSLVSKEDSKQPLSDESLRSLLSTKYLVKVARRTVTKYREEAGIGSSRARKIN